jgi:hypothetical protein
MRGNRAGAEDTRVRARPLLAALVGASALAALIGASTTASAGRACTAGQTAGGYSYAGHQASFRGHGVRATIAVTRLPFVEAGHVAGWVGVGGPGQGPNGNDEWIQAGIGAVPGAEPFLYAEVARDGRAPEFVPLDDEVGVGRRHRIAILETSARPGWWRVWVDGRAATDRIELAGSSGRWAPIATAESWNAGTAACNAFAFRFERVSISYGGGGSWRPFVSAHRFLDGTHRLHDLAAAPAASGVYRRTLASANVLPYAFVATSD